VKILFVTSNRVGDAILSTGILDHLLEQHPTARVTVACGPPAASLFQACDQVDNVMSLQKMRYAGHWARLWARSVGTFWNIIVDLRGSALAWLVPHAHHFIYRPIAEPIHRVESLSKLLGLTDPPAPKVWLRENHIASAGQLVPGGTVLALGPTANWGGKQWPAESFLNLANRLTAPGASLEGARVAVFGAEGERRMAEPLLAGLPQEGLVNLIGRTDLPLAAACLARCRVFVGNDSGLMHLAAATGVPTLGLFGPSPEQYYRPWGDQAAFVRTPESFQQIVGAEDYDYRSQQSRMTSLTVEAVLSAVENLVARSSRN
jgi:ADP-heptose:LPS heptosyltransferase